MKLQILASLSIVASTAGQGVTDNLTPTGKAPTGCEANSNGVFGLQTAPLTGMAKKDLASDNSADALVVQLINGVLTDNQGRTGYIASNYEFQFDNPPQAGALYTAGFSVCANGSLALGDSTIFWNCLSGNLFGLYSRSVGTQCMPVNIVILYPVGSSSVGSSQAQNTQSAVCT